jgi:predicted nucleic acid-binding OB-fold protein
MLERLYKKHLRKWLEERALRLPVSERKKIAQRLRVDEELVQAVEEAIVIEVIRRLDL